MIASRKSLADSLNTASAASVEGVVALAGAGRGVVGQHPIAETAQPVLGNSVDFRLDVEADERALGLGPFQQLSDQERGFTGPWRPQNDRPVLGAGMEWRAVELATPHPLGMLKGSPGAAHGVLAGQ